MKATVSGLIVSRRGSGLNVKVASFMLGSAHSIAGGAGVGSGATFVISLPWARAGECIGSAKLTAGY